MPCRIQHDPHQLLRLVRRRPRAEPLRAGDRRGQVVDRDVEVQLHRDVARAPAGQVGGTWSSSSWKASPVPSPYPGGLRTTQ